MAILRKRGIRVSRPIFRPGVRLRPSQVRDRRGARGRIGGRTARGRTSFMAMRRRFR